MPPRKAARKGPSRVAQEGRRTRDSSSSTSSEEEQGETSQVTVQQEEDDDEEENEEDEGENEEDSAEGRPGKKRRRRVAGMNKAEMKKWRRLAVEEKEAIVNEGGMVWRAAQPHLASLSTKQKKDISTVITRILTNVEEKLDKVVVPRTTSMPHASRNMNLAGGPASASSGSVAGSVMSWQVERGERLLEESEGLEKHDEMVILELGGFSSDIAVLETLLLPEATETVSMIRAVEEQERELELSRTHLISLKADRERRNREGEGVVSDFHTRMKRARELLQQAGSPLINRAEGMALRSAAAATSTA